MKPIIIRTYVCEKCGWTTETENYEIKECEGCKAPIEPILVYDENDER